MVKHKEIREAIMQHMVYARPKEVEDNSEVRYVDTAYGPERQSKSSIRCCLCHEFLWVVDSPTRYAVVLMEAFKVLDTRAYKNNVLPEYLKHSNVLLSCHWSCEADFIIQLDFESFEPV